jgi:pyruvate kinase
MDRKAKIVVTIGPACESEEKLEQLMKAGMNVARLNFSHGDREQHTEYIARIRRVSKRLDMSVGILQDLQGPKIRVGDLPKPLFLKPGEVIRLYAQEDPKPDCAEQVVPVDFPEFFESVHTEDRLLLDDGRLALSVVSAAQRTITASVVVGGTLFPHKGINLPGVRLRIPGFTDKDEIDLAFGLERAVDAVAISFVRSVDDVIAVRQAMKRLKKDQRKPLLIAKLERPEALDDLEKILEEVDGVMVARGDLGVEMPPERVPVIQKHIIQEANQRAKLVITATQMLESMIQSPLPTRAEASDVANAIFDGTDAVMLSGETASGEYPVESVQMMDRIIREAETHFLEWGQQQGRIALGGSDAASMAHAAHELARDRDVTAVAVFTNTGRTAWLMSKVRPRSPILAFTPDPETFLRLAFLWGVRPQLVPFAGSLEEMIHHVDQAITQSGVVQAGQQVVLVCGFPIDAMRPPNMALLHTVGE